MELVFGMSTLFAMLWILSRRIPVSPLSPVYALVGAYLLVFVVGRFFYDPAYSGQSAELYISEAESYSLAVQICWVLCGFTGGVLAFHIGTAKQVIRKNIAFVSSRRKLSTFQAQAALLFGVIAVAVLLFGSGVANVYHRSEYLTETNHILKILGGAFLPIGVFGFGAASTSDNRVIRLASIGAGVVAFALTLSLNTRLFSLVPGLFFAGALLINRKKAVLQVGLVFSLVASQFLIILPLYGRGMAEQGLSVIPELLGDLPYIDLNREWHKNVGNVLIAVPATVVTINANVGNNLSYVATEVNPLPGFMTDWQRIQQRVSKTIPCTSVGDVLRGGTWAGMCFFALVGMYFARIDQKMRNVHTLSISLFSLMALSYLFIILSLQYPLRGTARLIYYMVSIEVLVAIVNQLTRPKVHHQQADLRDRSRVPLDGASAAFPAAAGRTSMDFKRQEATGSQRA